MTARVRVVVYPVVETNKFIQLITHMRAKVLLAELVKTKAIDDRDTVISQMRTVT